MKNKHFASLALAALTAVSLCGCGNRTQSSDTASDKSSLNAPSETVTSNYPVPEDATFLRGAAGDVIGLSEITEAYNIENQKISPSELTAENFFSAKTDCAYYSLPLYPCLTDRESEYNEDDLTFKDAPPTACSDYIKVKKGDKIFGLTVAEAESEFTLYAPKPGVVVSTSITLEGEITVTGYARVVSDNVYGVSVGDILFVPVGKIDLPVIKFSDCDSDGKISRRVGDIYSMNDLFYTNEYTADFRLGNTATTTADTSALPSNGSFVKVSATISNIKMRASVDLAVMPYYSAELLNIDITE